MKHVAMTLSAIKHPLVVLMLIGGAVGCFYLWTPLFHIYVGIVGLNLLNVVVRLGGGVLFRGLGVTRAELAAAKAELDEEDAREQELVRQRLTANKAKLAALRVEAPEEAKKQTWCQIYEIGGEKAKTRPVFDPSAYENECLQQPGTGCGFIEGDRGHCSFGEDVPKRPKLRALSGGKK